LTTLGFPLLSVTSAVPDAGSDEITVPVTVPVVAPVGEVPMFTLGKLPMLTCAMMSSSVCSSVTSSGSCSDIDVTFPMSRIDLSALVLESVVPNCKTSSASLGVSRLAYGSPEVS
jgi:hypothetical protein